MAHEFDTGMSVRQMPWHGLGKILADYPETADEARTAAGLDWEPVEQPQFRRVLVGMNGAEPVYDYVEVPEFKYISRSDNGLVLASAEKDWTPFGHGEMFEIGESIVKVAADNGKKVLFETAGSLDEGRRVWLLINLGDRDLPGDPSKHTAYMALLNSHRPGGALKAIGTSVRIVCANTEKAADLEAQSRGTYFSFNHTTTIRDRVKDAADAIAGITMELEKVYARALYLIDRTITPAQRNEFTRQFAVRRMIANLGSRRSDLETLMAEPRFITRVNATVAELEKILEGPTSHGIYDTAYGLTQAAVEYLDHSRPARTAETRFSRNMLAGEPQKAMAHNLVDEVLATV